MVQHFAQEFVAQEPHVASEWRNSFCSNVRFPVQFFVGESVMQRYLAVSEARQQFLKLVDETLEGDEIIITKHGKPAVVLIDFEQLETFKWLARLWSDPEAMRHMREGMDDVKAGRAVKIKGPLTVENLLKAARERELVRG
jgi:antitoxin YefM